MSTLKIGRSHKARKALFARGIRRGFLTVGEIDQALPSEALTDAERWLLYYSLHASRVEIRDEAGAPMDLEELRAAAGAEDAREAADVSESVDDDYEPAPDPQ